MWNVELTRKVSVSVKEGAMWAPSLEVLDAAVMLFIKRSKQLHKADGISCPI